MVALHFQVIYRHASTDRQLGTGKAVALALDTEDPTGLGHQQCRAVIEHGRIVEGVLGARLDLGPARVGAADPDAPAQAEEQYLVTEADAAEPGTFIGRLQRSQALALRIPAQQQALLAGHMQYALMLEGGIEVETHRIVDLMREGYPVVAPVLGTEGIVERPQHDTVLRVGKMYGQEGLVAAFHLETLVLESSVLTQLHGTLAKLADQRRRGGTIQHLAPGLSAIFGFQYHAIMPDRPAEAGIEEMAGDQIRGDRRGLLQPALPGIVTDEDVPPTTYGHQALVRRFHRQQTVFQSMLQIRSCGPLDRQGNTCKAGAGKQDSAHKNKGFSKHNTHRKGGPAEQASPLVS